MSKHNQLALYSTAHGKGKRPVCEARRSTSHTSHAGINSITGVYLTRELYCIYNYTTNLLQHFPHNGCNGYKRREKERKSVSVRV